VLVTLDILEVGGRGDGVAERGGSRYFVPFTLPGETVEAVPRQPRGGGIAADLVKVLAPSLNREAPPCAHYGTCGGCALQHWRREAYTAWKTGLIGEALSRRGVAAPRMEPPVVGAPAERRRADFVLRRQGRRTLAGFHERASPRIVDVGTCVVLRPELNALLEPLRSALLEILPDGAAADVIVNATDSGLDVLIRPHKRFAPSLDAIENLVAFAHAADLARLSWGDRANADPIATRRTPRLAFGDVSIGPPPGAFLQATRQAESAMRAAVAHWLSGARRVADLFAGVGALTLGQAFRSTLYESDAAAVAATAKLGAVCRDLFRNPLIAVDLEPFDAVVLDPPRAGAVAQVAELAKSSISHIVYASCDAGSFSRDARALQDGGYHLQNLLPIDQFLWSVHVESIALFAR